MYPYGFQLICNLFQENLYTSRHWPRQNSFALTVTLLSLIWHLLLLVFFYFFFLVITCLVIDLPRRLHEVRDPAYVILYLCLPSDPKQVVGNYLSNK